MAHVRRWRAALVLPAVVACGSTESAAPLPARPVITTHPVLDAGPAKRTWAYPATTRRPRTATFFGTAVTDDFAWLEDGASPEVSSWVDAQNALTRLNLDALPERGPVRQRLAAIMGGTSADWFDLRHAAGTLFALKTEPPKQQAMLVAMRVEKDLAALTGERVVVDPNVLHPNGKTTIDFFVPSPDGKLVAVSLSKDGSEDGDVHVFDVGTGKEAGDVVTRVHGGTAGGSVAWRADGRGFWYTRYPRKGDRPEADLGFFQEVWFHVLGEEPSKDVYAFGKGLPKIAEIALRASDDAGAILAEVSNGDGGEIEHHVLLQRKGAPSNVGPWRRLTRFDEEASHATFAPDGKVYVVTRKDAPRGKVVAFAPPYDKPAVTVLPESDGVLEELVVTKEALYAIELVSGPSRVRRVPLDPKAEPLATSTPSRPGKKAPPGKSPAVIPAGARGVASAELPLPPVASVSGTIRIGDDLLLRVEGFTSPPAWLRYRASTHQLAKTALAKTSPVDLSDVQVSRETCTSKDGTRVPMTLLRRKDTPKDGLRPAYLTGYGGFAVSRKPRMRSWHRIWLDAGGVVADANLRGGGELGEAWHRAGMLTKKQNVFDDFAACMRALVDLGWTRAERLAIHGRSNGGLLVGATIVQHPDLFRAAVAEVGIHDMLRTELSPNGAFNVTEYGTVKDQAQFRALYQYSPLHNVKDGTAYPAVLFTTGENDPRVDPYHSRKMTARLQAATASDRPILLRASRGTGHGMGTPLAIEIEETADTIAFLMHEVSATPVR